MALGHHLGDRLCRPAERVSVAVPLRHKGKQAIGERSHVGKIGEAQALALQDAEELLDLIHP